MSLLTKGGLGVGGVGLDITANSASLPYYAFITFGDGTTADVALPSGSSFFGVTAPELVASIHFGLSGGATTTSGSFVIDNLTIGQADAPAPAPPATPVPALGLALLGLLLGAGAFQSRRKT
jgi:hypothetical protein